MGMYETSKVNLYVDVAEKIAWWERLQDFALDELKLSHGLRECVRIAYGYEFDLESFEAINRMSNVKPPVAKQKDLDYKNYKGATIICLVIPTPELWHWRKLRNELGFKSLEKLAKDGIRKILSIKPYGIVVDV